MSAGQITVARWAGQAAFPRPLPREHRHRGLPHRPLALSRAGLFPQALVQRPPAGRVLPTPKVGRKFGVVLPGVISEARSKFRLCSSAILYLPARNRASLTVQKFRSGTGLISSVAGDAFLTKPKRLILFSCRQCLLVNFRRRLL